MGLAYFIGKYSVIPIPRPYITNCSSSKAACYPWSRTLRLDTPPQLCSSQSVSQHSSWWCLAFWRRSTSAALCNNQYSQLFWHLVSASLLLVRAMALCGPFKGHMRYDQRLWAHIQKKKWDSIAKRITRNKNVPSRTSRGKRTHPMSVQRLRR